MVNSPKNLQKLRNAKRLKQQKHKQKLQIKSLNSRQKAFKQELLLKKQYLRETIERANLEYNIHNRCNLEEEAPYRSTVQFKQSIKKYVYMYGDERSADLQQAIIFHQTKNVVPEKGILKYFPPNLLNQ